MIWGVPLSSSDLFWFWRSSDWIWGVPLDVVGVHFGFGDVSLYLEHSALSFICRVFLRLEVTPRDLGSLGIWGSLLGFYDGFLSI